MLQIVLIRPGSTDFEEQGRIQGTLDIPLNEHGRQQVERMTAELSGLGIDTVYCSDCQPAVETAEKLAEALGVNLHTVLRAYQDLRDEGLVDMRRGRGAVVTDAATSLAELHDDIAALARRARALGLSPDTLASLVKEHR